MQEHSTIVIAVQEHSRNLPYKLLLQVNKRSVSGLSCYVPTKSRKLKKIPRCTNVPINVNPAGWGEGGWGVIWERCLGRSINSGFLSFDSVGFQGWSYICSYNPSNVFACAIALNASRE